MIVIEAKTTVQINFSITISNVGRYMPAKYSKCEKRLPTLVIGLADGSLVVVKVKVEIASTVM